MGTMTPTGTLSPLIGRSTSNRHFGGRAHPTFNELLSEILLKSPPAYVKFIILTPIRCAGGPLHSHPTDACKADIS
jgi:hypothetical protein